jgi:CheY-like chemotaxis protein
MTAAPECLRIVIAEDAAIMRDGLTQTLTRRGHDVVAALRYLES